MEGREGASDVSTAGENATRRVAAPKALASRHFRRLWTAVAVSQLGDWLHLTALGWYVLELGGTAAGVTSVAAAGLLPQLLLTLLGGVAADRWPKRRLLRNIALLQFMVAAIFVTLILLGALGVAGLAIFAFLLGSLAALWQPIYLSYLPDLVTSEQLDSAMSLSLSALYAARTVGPAAAGVLIALLGTRITFLFNGLTFLVPIIVLGTLSVLGTPPKHQTSPLKALKESALAVRHDIVLLPLWTLTAALSLLALPCLALIPVYAKDVFGSGAVTLGVLMTAPGLGQLFGSVVVTFGMLDGVRRQGLLQLLGYATMGVFLLAFAVAPSVAIAFAALLAFNLLHGFLSPRVNALVQRRVAAGRGTAQALFLLVFGLVPVGQVALGWLALRVGTVQAASSFAVAFSLAALLLLGAKGLRTYVQGPALQ